LLSYLTWKSCRFSTVRVVGVYHFLFY